jgi:hypothetical protein
LFSDLFNVSREAVSHPSDNAGASRNTFIDPSEHAEQINDFSNVESDSEDDDDDDDEDDDEEEDAESKFKVRRTSTAD